MPRLALGYTTQPSQVWIARLAALQSYMLMTAVLVQNANLGKLLLAIHSVVKTKHVTNKHTMTRRYAVFTITATFVRWRQISK